MARPPKKPAKLKDKRAEAGRPGEPEKARNEANNSQAGAQQAAGASPAVTAKQRAAASATASAPRNAATNAALKPMAGGVKKVKGQAKRETVAATAQPPVQPAKQKGKKKKKKKKGSQKGEQTEAQRAATDGAAQQSKQQQSKQPHAAAAAAEASKAGKRAAQETVVGLVPAAPAANLKLQPKPAVKIGKKSTAKARSAAQPKQSEEQKGKKIRGEKKEGDSLQVQQPQHPSTAAKKKKAPAKKASKPKQRQLQAKEAEQPQQPAAADGKQHAPAKAKTAKSKKRKQQEEASTSAVTDQLPANKQRAPAKATPGKAEKPELQAQAEAVAPAAVADPQQQAARPKQRKKVGAKKRGTVEDAIADEPAPAVAEATATPGEQPRAAKRRKVAAGAPGAAKQPAGKQLEAGLVLYCFDTNVLRRSKEGRVAEAWASIEAGGGSVVQVLVPLKVVHEMRSAQHRKMPGAAAGYQLLKAMMGNHQCCRVQREDEQFRAHPAKVGNQRGDDSILDSLLYFSSLGAQVVLVTQDKELTQRALEHDIPSLHPQQLPHVLHASLSGAGGGSGGGAAIGGGLASAIAAQPDGPAAAGAPSEAAPWSAMDSRELSLLIMKPGYQRAVLGTCFPPYSRDLFAALAMRLQQPLERVLLAATQVLAGHLMAPAVRNYYASMQAGLLQSAAGMAPAQLPMLLFAPQPQPPPQLPLQQAPWLAEPAARKFSAGPSSGGHNGGMSWQHQQHQQHHNQYQHYQHHQHHQQQHQGQTMPSVNHHNPMQARHVPRPQQISSSWQFPPAPPLQPPYAHQAEASAVARVPPPPPTTASSPPWGGFSWERQQARVRAPPEEERAPPPPPPPLPQLMPRQLLLQRQGGEEAPPPPLPRRLPQRLPQRLPEEDCGRPEARRRSGRLSGGPR